MKHTSSIQHALDLVIGRRLFTTCWLSASLGISIIQMRLLAQAWLVLPHALAPPRRLGRRRGVSRRCRSHRAPLLSPLVGARLLPLRLRSPTQVGECGCVLDWQILDCGPLATATGPAHAALALVVVLLTRTRPGLPGVSAAQPDGRWRYSDPGSRLRSAADAFR